MVRVLGKWICVGIVSDIINGIYFVDCFKKFVNDLKIKGLVLIGEIWGFVEGDVVVFIRGGGMCKVVVLFIVGKFFFLVG